MLISEIYQSQQGEGLLTGTASVFVRTSGCNLRCSFCDTPFASWEPEGQQYSIEQVLTQVHQHAEGARHVVVTGGEPMLPRDIVDLCCAMKRDGFHITIETAGTIYRELPCDLMSVSPKFTNSDPSVERAGAWRAKHMATRIRPQIVNQLTRDYAFQLKFVIEEPSDIDEVVEYLNPLDPLDPKRVLLMPQGTDLDSLEQRGQWLKPLCHAHGFTFCPRRHIEWYGNRRGT